MDRIGPTFGSELTAAGCADGVGWMLDGTLSFGQGATDAQRSAAATVLAVHDPARQLPRSASAKQVRYALNDLGARQAWNTAVMASPQADQDYWTSADPMYEANGKIAKWCKAAVITPKQLFDQAVAE